jgi:hypothetical protein
MKLRRNIAVAMRARNGSTFCGSRLTKVIIPAGYRKEVEGLRQANRLRPHERGMPRAAAYTDIDTWSSRPCQTLYLTGALRNQRSVFGDGS